MVENKVQRIVPETYIFDSRNSWYIDGSEDFFYESDKKEYELFTYDDGFEGWTTMGGSAKAAESYLYVEGETLW